jgi:two-component system, OmpR family, sensor histidine kinase TctE
MTRPHANQERPSLRLRLFAILAVPLLALMMLTGGIIYLSVLNYDNTEHDRGLVTTARSIAALISSGQEVGTLSPQVRYLLAYDSEGKNYFRVESSRHGILSSTDAYPVPPRVPGAQNEPLLFDSVVDGQAVRAVCLRVVVPIEPDDVITVTMAETLHSRQRLAREILVLTLVLQGLLIAGLLLLVWAGVRIGLRSLEPLMRKLRSREQGLDPITDATVPREILPLTLTLDALFRRLREAIDAQEDFIADAAHQLRTPLAGLQLHVERARAGGDAEETRAALGHMARLTARAGRTATQLLSLMRAQSPLADDDALARLDLAQHAVDVVSQRVPDGLRAGIDLGYQGRQSGEWINGNAPGLRDLIENLIDNAFAYTGRGHAVTVSVNTADDGTVHLAVEDDGPGVPEAFINRLGERFFRVPGGPDGGTGLGLAIVRRIADRHHATVQFQHGARGGLKVTIRFPRADQALR